MRDARFHSRGRMFVLFLKSCIKTNDLEQGCSIHADVARLGLLNTNVFIGSALVDFYAKCDSLSKAQEVFDSLKVPNVATWNALIGGYAQRGHGYEALCCLERMEEQGFCPNIITYTCSFKACACIRDLEKGSELHLNMFEEGLPMDTIVITALVDMYAKCGCLAKAQEVFDMLDVYDVATWNAMIAGFVQNECGEEALTCFEKMQLKGASPDAVTLACALKACGLVKAIGKGEELHAEVVRTGLLRVDAFVGSALVDMYGKCGMLAKAHEVFDVLPDRDVVTWNALIVGYILQDCCEEALLCFDEMRQEGVCSNAASYSCSLSACGSIGALDKGSEMHTDVLRKGLLEVDLAIGSALVNMYAKCGALAKAQGVFEKLSVRNTYTWNALITGYAQIGDIEMVLLMFDRLVEDDKVPLPVTFVGILCACSHSGLVDKGLECFKRMAGDYNMIPTLVHHNCMIDLMGRAGQLDRALAFVQESPHFPTIEMWLALLGACRKWGNVELGRQAFEHAILVDETEGAAYISMSNIYAEAGLLDNAKEVEAMRVQKQAWKRKQPGVWSNSSEITHPISVVN